MKRYVKTVLVLLLTVSIVFNLINYINLMEAREKIQRANTIVSADVERGIRQSKLYIEELIEEENSQALDRLTKAVGNLAMDFGHWVELNKPSRKPSLTMDSGLASVEMIRNTISHHLANQFATNDDRLTKFDIEMLESTSEQLSKLLLIYHNIEERFLGASPSEDNENGLQQFSNSIEEIHKLYRHSKMPNQHPEYIDKAEALAIALEAMPFLKEYQSEEEDGVMIREGVHYYEFHFLKDKEELYTAWVDATDGEIRNFELLQTAENGDSIPQNEAISIARDFAKKLYRAQMDEEMFYVEDREDSPNIYSFRFIPKIDGVRLMCDAFTINIAASTGEIIKYTKDFSNTKFHQQEPALMVEDVQELYMEEFDNMDYNGLSIIRSFHTHYRPKLTYSFRIIQEGQENMVFIDVNSGTNLQQSYYAYHPIFD